MVTYARRVQLESKRTPEEIAERAEQLKAIRKLRWRSGQEWAKSIRKLELPYLPSPADGVTAEHIRCQVACIVWWDWFGGRPYTLRWPHLDTYLKRPYIFIRKEIIREGLVLLGYPAKYAKSRIK